MNRRWRWWVAREVNDQRWADMHSDTERGQAVMRHVRAECEWANSRRTYRPTSADAGWWVTLDASTPMEHARPTAFGAEARMGNER